MFNFNMRGDIFLIIKRVACQAKEPPNTNLHRVPTRLVTALVEAAAGLQSVRNSFGNTSQAKVKQNSTYSGVNCSMVQKQMSPLNFSLDFNVEVQKLWRVGSCRLARSLKKKKKFTNTVTSGWSQRIRWFCARSLKAALWTNGDNITLSRQDKHV